MVRYEGTTLVLMNLCTPRGRGAAKLRGKLRPLEADTLQAVTLGRQPATAREAFQMQQDGITAGAGGLTGRWRKVKVRCSKTVSLCLVTLHASHVGQSTSDAAARPEVIAVLALAASL